MRVGDIVRRSPDSLNWVLGGLVTLLAVIVWWQARQPQTGLSVYDVFPLFGLVAFGLMWTHFVYGALQRRLNLPKPKSDTYWTVSAGLVLALMVLHPLLLNYGLYSDGLGLPPASYATAYGDLAPYLLLGTVCLIVFLAFELKRFFGDKPWWKVIDRIQILAMVGIFIHALMLGQELSETWYLVVWWIYGVTLIVSWAYTMYIDKKGGEHERTVK